MKIISLKSENIKRIKAVEIKPDPQGNLIIISGKNNQGKSSVLDSIWYALGGKESIPIKPIREGEKAAKIEVDLGDYKVERHWTADDKTYLKVINKDGATFPSPQALLDKFIGNLSFDPLEFAEMDSKEQRDTLLGLLKIEEKLIQLDKDRKEIYEDRTIIGRQLKAVQGHLQSFNEPNPDLPKEEININNLITELNQAQQYNNQARELKGNISEFEITIGGLENSIEEGNNRINRLKAEIKEEEEKIIRFKNELNAKITRKSELANELKNFQLKDISALEKRVTDAEQINREIRTAKEYLKRKTEISEFEKKTKALTDSIDKIDNEKQKILSEAKFPIDNLSFDEEGVFFNRIPFCQLSSSEQLKISLAIAMAMNPTLKVIRILDGSLLDKDNLKFIEGLAKEKDYQIWIEITDDSGELGVYIEDGMVK